MHVYTDGYTLECSMALSHPTILKLYSVNTNGLIAMLLELATMPFSRTALTLQMLFKQFLICFTIWKLLLELFCV